MDAHEAVLAAAQIGLRAETAEEGYAAIRAMTVTAFTDRALAEAVAVAVANRSVRDPVRLVEGALQCHWRLQSAG